MKFNGFWAGSPENKGRPGGAETMKKGAPFMTAQDYRSVLETAGPKMKEYVLSHAEKDPKITLEEFFSLVKFAYPDETP